jgi:dolichyl-diphosphooligosaccharide--protein glycosyltransferase
VAQAADHRQALVCWALLAAVILIALWLRMDDLLQWRNQPQRAFFDNRPILTNFDGYFYLSLARDLVEDQYSGPDRLRGAPQPPPRPFPPPLISLIAAGLAGTRLISLDWVATLLPPILGVTLAIPLWLIGRLFGGRIMALLCVAVGLFADYYIYRSSVGWFDTDCLNVTLLMALCYLFIRFGLEPKRRRYAYLGAGVAIYLIFLWWWDQTPAVVSLISLAPLGLAILFLYRPTGVERRMAWVVGICGVMVLLLCLGPHTLVAPLREALIQWGYIAKQRGGDFANVGISIFEQKALDLESVVNRTAGHWTTFAIAVAGLCWFLTTHWRTAAPLVVPLAIGCLTLFYARRFLIFLSPFMAIGLGYILQRLWDWRSRQPWLRYFIPALVAVVLFFPLAESGKRVYWPKEIPALVEGMKGAGDLSDPSAVIWAWWDHGYPMIYWSRRATINDGSLHGGMRTTVNAIPLMAHNQRFAARFIHFYIARGMEGLQRFFTAAGGAARGMALIHSVFGADPIEAERLLAQADLMPADSWYDFFFPTDTRDAYLFLDLRLARITHWWSWFGTWDVERQKGTHSRFKLFLNCKIQGESLWAEDLQVELKFGRAIYDGRAYDLQAAYILDAAGPSERTYRSNGLLLTCDPQTRVATLMEPEFAPVLFNQLFVFNKPQTDLFSLSGARFPYYQIWRVHNPNGKTER